MYGKRFEKEFEMIEKALIDEQGEIAFRKYINDFVERIVDNYIKENSLEHINRDLILNAGWTHLQSALKKYKSRAEMMLNKDNELYYFDTYFNWFIRQGILEYLNSLKPKPSERY